MIDWRQRHLDKAHAERRAILMEDATMEQWRNGRWPVGSMWLWALGVVGARNSAIEPDKRTGKTS